MYGGTIHEIKIFTFHILKNNPIRHSVGLMSIHVVQEIHRSFKRSHRILIAVGDVYVIEISHNNTDRLIFRMLSISWLGKCCFRNLLQKCFCLHRSFRLSGGGNGLRCT